LKGTKMIRKRTTTLIAAAAASLLSGGTARSAPPAKPGRGPTAAEFAALKQQVDRQNELIMKLTQLEGEHYDFLLKLLQNGRPGMAHVTLPPPSSSPPPAPPPATTATPASPPTASAPVEREAPGGHAKLGSITGRVDVKGKSRGPVYVYVDNIKEPAVDRSIEIMQKNREFVPDTVVAQRGTRVSFPNADPVLHNVFSPSPTQPFDLGSYHQGEKAGVVRLFASGVVEVFCNMHSKMQADILVVPNHHYVKVNPDGSFRLDNVPIGSRQVAAWTPDAHPVSETVNLTASGASVNFALRPEPHAHATKEGKPYDSYNK